MASFLHIGRNANNEFGSKNKKRRSKLTPLNTLDEYGIKQIYTGNGYNIYSDKKQNYWAAGNNRNGECAVNTSQKTIKSLTKIDCFKRNQIKIKKVCVNVSGNCTFFISNKNILYGAGWNKHMQLSVITANDSMTIPILIPDAPRNIIDIKSAFNYTLVLLQNGQILATSFSKYGGNGLRKNKFGKNKQGFKRIDINRKIIKIAAGYYHSLFLDTNGTVWCCGKNNYGQLGLGHNKICKSLTPIRYFIHNGIQINDIRSGGNFNIALDVNGKIYAWGANNCGQCGIGHTENINVPQLIPLHVRIRYIKCGRNHAYVCGENKHYLFGNNYWNQCIVPNEKLIKCPMLIKNSIKNIYLGYDSTVLTLDDDEKKQMLCDNNNNNENKDDEKKGTAVWEYKSYNNEWKAYDNKMQIMIELLALKQNYQFTENNEQQEIYKITQTKAMHFNITSDKNIEMRRQIKYGHKSFNNPCNCLYYSIAKKILRQEFPSIPKESFDDNHNMCYCLDCHIERGDKIIYERGRPAKKYALPIGFARFGLKIDEGFCKMHPVFDDWHVCYHGTKKETVPKIFKGKLTLLKPGDVAIGGNQLGIRNGHIQRKRNRHNKYTGRQELFDPNQIYISPSIKYASHEVYAEWITCKHPVNKNKQVKVQFVFHCRIRPQSYDIGQETVGATDTLDENFANDEIEWYTKENVAITLQGLLLRFELIK